MWHFDELIAARSGSIHGSGYCCGMVADNWPDTRTECSQGKLAARRVLRIRDVPVRPDQHERSRLRSPQRYTIFQLRRPVHVDDSTDFMPREVAPHANRKVLIEQDAQRGGSWRRPELPGLDPAVFRAAFRTSPRFRRRSGHKQNCPQSPEPAFEFSAIGPRRSAQSV